MDTGRTVYRLTQLYVSGLCLAGVFTLGWLFVPRVRESIQVAGLWFGSRGSGS
ncbi:hypothetical protein [Halospeciosus flavus]|uniref:hypothetical protein n=1 Tax=Halospeciosus flavus TaxID=3032283 RepID=UPI003614E281